MVEPTSFLDPELAAAALDAEWRCRRRKARGLTLLELAETSLAVGILVIVALCGIVALTHTAVASGEVALPLGLGLAVTIALSILGLAFRVRMGHETLSQEIFKLDCARRAAAELARLRVSASHPYRAPAPSAAPAVPRCFLCLAASHRSALCAKH